jgi:general stress protein CsbA
VNEMAAEVLDHFRASLLRTTLRLGIFRFWFLDRPSRLLLLFSLAAGLALGFSLAFPLWVLLLGPLVYGVPHVFSSIRYFHHSVSKNASDSERFKMFHVLITLLGAVFIYRLFITADYFHLSLPSMSEWAGSTYIELIALALTLALASRIYRIPVKQVLRGVLFSTPLIVGFWFSPAWTIGALVLIHNFVAFFYWMIVSDFGERKVAVIAFAATFLITVLIFAGIFDGFTHPAYILDLAQLSVVDTGKLIVPWSSSEKLFLHACVAFAFGQSLHYFVWLKAIPDQHHYQKIPTSFRQSLALLREDFGYTLASALIALSVGSILFWSFLSFQKARLIYFCLASYHGYLELAGLMLIAGSFTLRPKQG